MMLSVLIFSAVCIIIILAAEDQQTSRDICLARYKVDDAILSRARAGDVSMEDQTLKDYINCFYFTLGFIDEDANLQIDNMTKMEQDESSIPKLIATTNDCEKIIGTDPVDRSWNIYKCYRENYPVLDPGFEI